MLPSNWVDCLLGSRDRDASPAKLALERPLCVLGDLFPEGSIRWSFPVACQFSAEAALTLSRDGSFCFMLVRFWYQARSPCSGAGLSHVACPDLESAVGCVSHAGHQSVALDEGRHGHYWRLTQSGEGLTFAPGFPLGVGGGVLQQYHQDIKEAIVPDRYFSERNNKWRHLSLRLPRQEDAARVTAVTWCSVATREEPVLWKSTLMTHNQCC